MRRKKPGRPPKKRDGINDLERVLIGIPKWLLARVDEGAGRRGITRSDWIRQACVRYAAEKISAE